MSFKFLRKLQFPLMFVALVIGVLCFTGTAHAAVHHIVKPSDSFYLIARNYGLTSEQLMKANGLISTALVPEQIITIPDKYIVKPGDTLHSIAKSYGYSVNSLMSVNDLKTEKINPGQILLIPAIGLTAAKQGKQYTVKKGDTIYSIAKEHGLTVEDIISHNNLKTTYLTTGQRLVLPEKSKDTGKQPAEKIPDAVKQPTDEVSSYTVQKGDTLHLIAQAYGTTPDALIASNNLSSHEIYPGQVILISGSRQNESHPSRGEITSQDTYLLAQLITAEAQGEPFEGQVAVGAVVLNRIADSRFPNTISGVIYEPWQFEPVTNGQIYNTPDPMCIRAAEAALSGWDPSEGAVFFFNPDKAAGDFFWTLTYVKRIGKHVFYK